MTPLLELLDRSPAFSSALYLAAKASVPLIAAALFTLALRRRSAAARHFVWTLALFGALAVPMLAGLLPEWSVSVPISPVRSTAAAAEAAGPQPRRGAGNPNLRFEISNLKSPAAEDEISNLKSPKAEDDASLTPAPVEPAKARVNWTVSLAIAWGFGAAVVSLPMLAGIAGLALLSRRGAPVRDPVLLRRLHGASDAIGLGRRVMLLQSADAAMPMTWGWLRPTVLLPAGFAEWTEDRQRVVLLHELAHIKRLDCLTQQLAQLVVAVYWFNPLAWLAAHRMRIERECACDDLVLLNGSRPSEYALHLLTIARAMRAPGMLRAAAVAMARHSALENRIRSILDARSRRRVLQRGVAIVGLVVAVAFVLPLSVLRLRAADEPKGTAPPATPRLEGPITVGGIVVDPAGKPVSGAEIVVLALRKRSTADRDTPKQPDVLGTAESDRGGRFAVSVPWLSSVRYWHPTVLAGMPAHGLAGISFPTAAAPTDLMLSLQRERVVRGRLVDLQGQPAAGVEVRVASVSTYSPSNFNTGYSAEPGQLGAPWPERAITDSQGRFSIRGLAQNQHIRLAVRDDRYAHEELDLERNDPQAEREKAFSLSPAQSFEIRVVGEDTGSGISHARVLVSSQQGTGASRRSRGYLVFEADANGRLMVHPKPGDHFAIAAYPPAGEPYLLRSREVAWPKAAVKQELELALPKGVVVRGQVTESGSSRPVADARVSYLQPYDNNPFYRSDGHSPWFGWGPDAITGPDGRFALAVSPGKGHLLIQGPSAEFLHVEASTRDLTPGVHGNERAYPDGLVKLDLKPDARTHDVSVQLRRGITVTGRVVDPEGRPVSQAVLFCRTYVPFSYLSSECGYSGETIAVRDGRFELPGLDPEKPVPVFFFDVRNALGAVVELSGKSAVAGPVTVKLQKCGAVRLRLVDKEGKLVTGLKPSAEVVVTPGAHFPGEADNPRADSVHQANLDRERQNQLAADNQGRFTLPALIPGASYLLWGRNPNGGIRPVEQRFTAEAGKTLELNDVTVNLQR